MDNLAQNDLIERYLDGMLSSIEREAVEARLATDSVFKAELELQRQIHIELADPKKLQLRDMLGDILQKEPAPPEITRPAWLKMTGLGLIVLLGMLGIWWMFTPTQTSIPVSPAQPSQQIQSPQNTNMPDSLNKQPEKVVQGPIAMADKSSYKLNPVFEARLGNGGIRSSDGGSVEIQSPVSGSDFTIAKGQLKIQFKGAISVDSDQQEFPLEINIYNNKSSDTPVAAFTPRITNRKEQVEKWTFSTMETLRLAPGLYYFTLERKSDAELLYVGKFTVDKKVSGGK